MQNTFNINEFIQSGEKFLHNLCAQLADLGVDTSELTIDHICFRVSNNVEYEFYKTSLMSCAQLLTETPVNGRFISTFKMSPGFNFDGQRTNLIELPAVKEGVCYETGFEHAEYLIEESIKSFQDKFKNLLFKRSAREIVLKTSHGIAKFHHVSLERTIEIEKAFITDIIFDLDGTIVDSHGLICEINQTVFSKVLGRNILREEVVENFYPCFKDQCLAFGVTNVDEQAQAVKLWSIESERKYFLPFQDIKELLVFLKSQNMRLHIWSARDEISGRKILFDLDIISHFESLSFYDEKGSKPDPKNLGSNFDLSAKNSTLFVGDSIIDIVGARNINAISVAALWNHFSNREEIQAQADLSFDTIEDFKNWIEQKIRYQSEVSN